MVKGTSRRVIVVDSPDTELFEQAIFIVRNDAMNRNGVTAQRRRSLPRGAHLRPHGDMQQAQLF